MDNSVVAVADRAALFMRTQRLPPVQAVTAAYKEQFGGTAQDEAFKRAVLAELGRRGGRKKALKQHNDDDFLRRRMEHEAELTARARSDHLLPDS